MEKERRESTATRNSTAISGAIFIGFFSTDQKQENAIKISWAHDRF